MFFSALARAGEAPFISASGAGCYAELPEQVGEELAQHGLGVPGVLEFGGAEAEYLVPGELELGVGAGALGVHGGVRAAAGTVVSGAVYLEHDPVPVRQQEQEVHAQIQQGLRAALADCLRVPVQPDLGQEGREPGYRAGVDVLVGLEQVPLGGEFSGRLPRSLS